MRTSITSGDRLSRLLLLGAATSLFAACGPMIPEQGPHQGPPTTSPDAGAPGPDAVPTWWTDVQPLVQRDCSMCHGATPLYGAPMSLVSYADVAKPAWSDASRTTHALMVDRIKQIGGKPIMPPAQTGRLSAEEISRIERWSAAGAPEGTRPETPPGKDPDPEDMMMDPMHEDPPVDEEAPYTNVDVTAPQAVVRAGATDEYACFRTILHLDKTVDAVEITPLVDKAAVVHHILIFRDRGRNYPASKTGLLCAADTLSQNDWELLHGWAPGGGNNVLPKEAGVRLQDGDYIVVQIHYNNPTNATVMDSSGARFKTTAKLRANEASSVGVGIQGFSLPPGQPSVSRSGECTLTKSITIFGNSPHMHLLGRGAKLELVRGGSTTPLLDMTGFTFDTQAIYPMPAMTLQAGDKLRATCTWDTSGRAGTTDFGEGTTDEMCYIFVSHYPSLNTFSCVR